jgi:Trypsin-co-occurring domain 2
MSGEDDGVLVTSLVAEIKDALVTAGVTRANPALDLRVDSVQLILEVVATKAGGGRLSLRVPFIGTELSVGGKLARHDAHTIDIILKPPDQAAAGGVHGPDVQKTLVEAIRTIRMTMLSAAEGKDPWVLSAGSVDISFGVTKDGVISIGAEGELTSEATNTLRLKLVPG